MPQTNLDIERHGSYKWSWRFIADAIDWINGMFTELYAARMFNALDAGGMFAENEYINTQSNTNRVGKPQSGTYLGYYVMQRTLTPLGFEGEEDIDFETYYSKSI